jgi:DNA segregation ATPase FtsK/SpoIIIE-like protein
MNTIVLFNEDSCIEISSKTLPYETSFGEKLKRLSNKQSLVSQLSLKANQIKEIGEEIKILHLDSPKRYYSVKGKLPIRLGTSEKDQITIESEITLSIVIYEDKISIIEGEDIYLNGKRLDRGTHKIATGNVLWVKGNYLEFHKDYLAFAGEGYTSKLNISTMTPKPYEEFPIYKRSPRIIRREPQDKIELASPQKKEERKKGELALTILPPLMTSMVMVGGGILIGRGLFILIMAGATVVSVVFSATRFIVGKKERKRKEKARDVAYDKYLLRKRKEIHKAYESQRKSLLYHNLSPTEIEKEIEFYSPRLYERAANDSDFLTLSLGNSSVEPSFKVDYDSENEEVSEDPLYEEMLEVGSSYQALEGMPTVIDLKEAHLGLVGEKPYIHRQLTSILTQLCFFQSYHDIELVILVEEEDRPTFEWSRWYPHCRIKSINVSGLISAENHRDQVLGNIAQVLKMRRQKQEEEKKDSRYLPHYLFIVDNPKLIINHSIMEYLQTPETSLGFSVIYTTHIQANLPEYIKSVFLLEGGDYGTLLMNNGTLLNKGVTIPYVADINLEMMARRLAPLKHSQGVSTQIPETVTFFELYNIKRPQEIPILQLWNHNACHKSLAVPLGLRGKEDIVALNLHEKAHGPHGLVAGTTGSGKSEIVQSYILSLAVNFHPYEVGFLLIDYKGGGMANLFAKLPHLLGTITNLDGSESMRALVSIKSELARRQRIFNDNNVNNINQYTKLFKAGEATEPLPHLFLISDEFAELKKEQPEFMSELVSAARIGRSLGVHLILATQKPSGVVDDQIWSNSKFKLALKVANESDSKEVLKTPDAARITQPGRAYLQVGNNEIYELFQSAYSGAPYSEETVERGFDSRVYAINQLGQGELLNEDLSEVDKTEDSKLTQLDVVVDYIHILYQALGAKTVEKPWLPPLPEKLVNEDIALRVGVEHIEKIEEQEEQEIQEEHGEQGEHGEQEEHKEHVEKIEDQEVHEEQGVQEEQEVQEVHEVYGEQGEHEAQEEQEVQEEQGEHGEQGEHKEHKEHIEKIEDQEDQEEHEAQEEHQEPEEKTEEIKEMAEKIDADDREETTEETTEESTEETIVVEREYLDVGKIRELNLNALIGVVDIPEEQKQVEYNHNFIEEGNLAIFGATGFGKSTVLMNIALTLATQNSPSLLNYFILDYGNSALAQLRGLPHTADYLGIDDEEKLEKLEKLLEEELKRRKTLFAATNALNFRMYNESAMEKLPAMVLFIDNYDVIKEVSPDLEMFLGKITRDGVGMGIYTLITGSRGGAVRYAVLNNFKNKIALFMTDKSDIVTLIGRSDYDLPEIRGRALIKLKDIHVAQCYLAVDSEDDTAYAKGIAEIVDNISKHNTAKKATGIRVLPEVITYQDLEPYVKTEDKQGIIGFDIESTNPLYLDLSIPIQTIVGAAATGKTNILKLLLTQFEGASCYVADSRVGDLADYEGLHLVNYMGVESQLEHFYEELEKEVTRRTEGFEEAKAQADEPRDEEKDEGAEEKVITTKTPLKLKDYLASLPPILVLIDDADNFVELCKTKTTDMEKLLPKAKNMGITFIITTLPNQLRGYDGITKELRDNQSALVLGVPGEQNLIPILTPKGYKATPELGFWYKRGDIKQVKIPLV